MAPKQSSRTLRRRKRQSSGSVCDPECQGLLAPFWGVALFLALAGTGLAYEFLFATSTTATTLLTLEESQQQHRRDAAPITPTDGENNFVLPPHLQPVVPVLPIFAPIDNSKQLIENLLHHHQPTMAGIQAYLQSFCQQLHISNAQLAADPQRSADQVVQRFYQLAAKHLAPLEDAYRNGPIFPLRQDGSIFLSLAAFREHLLADTLAYAFSHAKHPDQLFVGAVVQNCFGAVSDDGLTINATGLPCHTGAQVVGKNAQGHDMTKVSEAPPDVNGIADFCTQAIFQKYCERGQVRVLYVHETESLGPAMARYYASKLWGGETYFMQTDSHLLFASEWDEKYRQEIRATSNYPKSVLSSYPPGFNMIQKNPNHNSATALSNHTQQMVRESNGARLCYCETRMEDPNPIVRINSGQGYTGGEPRPTQIPYIAAGFFFARAECLEEWPFDPYMPWLFMGEEIALSMRAWTNGWNIYAPRKNLIAHQYRPGRMGLPKFWGTVNRLFHGRPGNNKLQHPVIKRVKHLVGYPDSSLEKIKEEKLEYVLTDLEHFGLGKTRSWQEYMDFAYMSIDEEKDVIVCKHNDWCNKGLKD